VPPTDDTDRPHRTDRDEALYQRVYAMRVEQGMTFAAIGEAEGFTRQRAAAIAYAMGYRTPTPPRRGRARAPRRDA
jgi:hypothetical protein